MLKQEISTRVLKNGSPLDLSKFEWDEEKNQFITSEPFLTIDFSDLHDMNVTIGDASTLVIWNNSDIKMGRMCTLICGLNSQVISESDCNIDAGIGSKIKSMYGTIIISRESKNKIAHLVLPSDEIIDETSVGDIVYIPINVSEETISNEPIQFTHKIKIGGQLVEVTHDQFEKISEIIKLK